MERNTTKEVKSDNENGAVVATADVVVVVENERKERMRKMMNVENEGRRKRDNEKILASLCWAMRECKRGCGGRCGGPVGEVVVVARAERRANGRDDESMSAVGRRGEGLRLVRGRELGDLAMTI